MAIPERPLSPFTDIYRWQITMTLSILHRITGVILAFGAFGVAWWLLVVSGGGDRYNQTMRIADSVPGQVVLAGFSFCLIYHLLNGLRHLLWDSGRGFEIRQFQITGWTVVVLSVVFTAVLWAMTLTQGTSP